MYFNCDPLEFRHEPCPTGLAKPLIEPGLYGEMLADYLFVRLFSADCPAHTDSGRPECSVYFQSLRSEYVTGQATAWRPASQPLRMRYLLV